MGATNDRKYRTGRRSFRPALEGTHRLESRELLSGIKTVVTGLPRVLTAREPATGPVARPEGMGQSQGQGKVTTTAAGPHQPHQRAYAHSPRILTMAGGRGVRILDGNGGIFNVGVESGPGTVRAKALRDGRFEIRAIGTGESSELVITAMRVAGKIGMGHTYNPQLGRGGEVLDIAEIVVTSGEIGSVLGYRTANLSGPLVLDTDAPVNRIALNRLDPGALIQTAGDLNTLNVFTDATLEGDGTGVMVGRDLNWVTIGGDLSIADGATLETDRDLGLVAQPAKDSSPPGVGILVEGSVVLGPTGSWTVRRDLAGPIMIRGDFTGSDQFTVFGTVIAPITVLGTITP